MLWHSSQRIHPAENSHEPGTYSLRLAGYLGFLVALPEVASAQSSLALYLRGLKQLNY